MLMPQLSAPPSPLCRSRLCLVKTEWTSELVTRFRELRGDVQAPPGLSAAASLAEEAATATAAAATAATAAAATAAATDAATSADAGAGAAAAMPPAPGGAADAPAAAAADAVTHADADATAVRPAKRAKLEGTRAERGRGGSMPAQRRRQAPARAAKELRIAEVAKLLPQLRALDGCCVGACLVLLAISRRGYYKAADMVDLRVLRPRGDRQERGLETVGEACAAMGDCGCWDSPPPLHVVEREWGSFMVAEGRPKVLQYENAVLTRILWNPVTERPTGVCATCMTRWFGIPASRTARLISARADCARFGIPVNHEHGLVSYRRLHAPANRISPRARMIIAQHFEKSTDLIRQSLTLLNVKRPGRRGALPLAPPSAEVHSDVRHKALLAPPALGDARGEGRHRRGTAVAEPPPGEAVHVGCHERAERVTAAAAPAPERLAPNPPTTTGTVIPDGPPPILPACRLARLITGCRSSTGYSKVGSLAHRRCAL